jgi:hypothetical protein
MFHFFRFLLNNRIAEKTGVFSGSELKEMELKGVD